MKKITIAVFLLLSCLSLSFAETFEINRLARSKKEVENSTDLDMNLPLGTFIYVNSTDSIYVKKNEGYELLGNKSMETHLATYDHTQIGQGSADLTDYFNTTTNTTDDLTQGDNLFTNATEKTAWDNKGISNLTDSDIDANTNVTLGVTANGWGDHSVVGYGTSNLTLATVVGLSNLTSYYNTTATLALPTLTYFYNKTDADAKYALIGQTMYIGTTAHNLNRASAAETLAGLTLTTPVLGAATYTTLSGGAVTDSSLTATRVTFAGTAGLLSDDAGFTFTAASDQLLLGEAGTSGSLKLYSEDGGTDHSTIFNPGIQTQDVTYTLPVDDGTVSQVLSTNGAGVLTWATPSPVTYTLVATLAGDQATGANTTPVALTGLVWTYAASSTYFFRWEGGVLPAATSTGCGFELDVSGAITEISMTFTHQLANTGTVCLGSSRADNAAIGVTSAMASTSVITAVSGSGMLRTAAGQTGTAQLMIQSETTAVTTAKAGLTLVVEKVN